MFADDAYRYFFSFSCERNSGVTGVRVSKVIGCLVRCAAKMVKKAAISVEPAGQSRCGSLGWAPFCSFANAIAH